MSHRAKTPPQYRPILTSALHHVFLKRDVWFFGIFALILGSGSAIETVLRTRNGLEAFNAPFLYQFFPFLEPLRQWTDQLSTLSSLRAVLTVVLFLLLAGLLISASAVSQGVIIHAAKTQRKQRNVHDLIRRGAQKFWQVLGIGLLLKIALGICVFILLAPSPQTTILLAAGILTLLQPLVGYGLMLGASAVAVYALIAVVNHDASFGGALKEAWRVFQTYPGTSMEIIIILFVLNLLAGISVLALTLLLAIPYTALFLLGALGGSLLATTLVTTVAFLAMLALLVILGGTTTAYNYTVLTMIYEKLRAGRFHGKLHRVRTTGHWF